MKTLRRVPVQVRCYGMKDYLCNETLVKLQELRNVLLIDHKVDIQIIVENVAVNAYSPLAGSFHEPKNFEDLIRIIINNKYALTFNELGTETLVSYVLRTLLEAGGFEESTDESVISANLESLVWSEA